MRNEKSKNRESKNREIKKSRTEESQTGSQQDFDETSAGQTEKRRKRATQNSENCEVVKVTNAENREHHTIDASHGTADTEKRKHTAYQPHHRSTAERRRYKHIKHYK